jgi:alkylhydroperoxidase family enzyme
MSPLLLLQVVAELQQRSKQVAFEAAALTNMRQQLAALDAQRRAALRAIDDALATAGARLDDRAKEEKLRQIRCTEEAYQVSTHACAVGMKPWPSYVGRECVCLGTVQELSKGV